MTAEETGGRVRGDHQFAMVPEYVLFADISGNAVRLFGVLNRHAQKADSVAHVRGRVLAAECRMSPATYNRALLELREVGAVTTIATRNAAGDQGANDFVIHMAPSRDYVAAAAQEPTARPKRSRKTSGGRNSERTPSHGREAGSPHGREGVSSPVRGQEGEPFNESPLNENTPQPPAAQGAGEGSTRGVLDFNRSKRRTTPPADPRGEERPEAQESFEEAAPATWDQSASAAFLDFWSAYPRADYPERALKVWNRKKLDRIADRVVAGAQRYAADPNRVGQFTATPANWLDGGGWDNGPLPARAPQSRAEAEQQHFDGMFSRAAARAASRDADALVAVEGTSVRQIGGAW